MKISNTILLSFFGILLLFSIATYLNYKLSEQVNENSEKFAESSLVVRQSNRFQRNFLNMLSGLRGYALTNEPFFIQTYDSAIEENVSILEEIRSHIRINSPQSQILKEIHKLNYNWVNEFAEPLIQVKKNSSISDSSRAAFNELYRTQLIAGREKEIQTRLQTKFAEFTNIEYKYRESQKDQLTASVQNTRSISFSLTAVSIVIGICIALILARDISSKIVRMVKMANQIAEGNYEVSMPDPGRNELSQLSQALNSMAKILSKNISLLKIKNNELNQFAHIVSHDLKAPLRGIDNVVTWIEEDHSLQLPPKVVEFLDLIKGRIRRAENLLNGILMYSRIGREKQNLEMVDVNALLMEVKEYLPKNRGIRFDVTNGLPVLYAERIPLLQVFTNLIVNAFKYHNKEDGFVKVYGKPRGEYFEFFVEDNGPGIDKIYHEKIFVIFQTLQERDVIETTGIGLAIVKKILDDRKLKITIDSAPGKGSTFSFLWPKKQTNETIN